MGCGGIQVYTHTNSDLTEEERYSPDIAEDKYQQNLRDKGPDLKIGKDHRLAEYIETKIAEDGYSPGAVLGEIKAKGLEFETEISKPTLYSYIDKGIFLTITNKELPVKGRRKKKNKKVRRQARANAGTSIEKRPEDIDTREEFGHWEMDTVVGKRGESKHSLLVLTERKTRNELIYLLYEHTTEQVCKRLDQLEAEWGERFGQVFKTDFSGVGLLNFFAVMFSFLFVDLFDTLGTLIGVASKADMLDEDGRLPNIKGALMADSIGTCVGAVLGTSTTTTFVESASGVTEGGRTGLTAMTTGVLFLLATIFSPLFLTIPSFATAPALIIVGFYMMGSAIKIDFNDPSEGIPAFLTILAMPTAYSISEGIAIGIISWTIINVITGKAKEKKISPLMYVLTVLFILKYVCL